MHKAQILAVSLAMHVFGRKGKMKSSWELRMHLRLYTYKHFDALLVESRLPILLQPVYSSGMLHLYFLLYHILYSHLWVDQSYSTLNASTMSIHAHAIPLQGITLYPYFPFQFTDLFIYMSLLYIACFAQDRDI